MRTQTEGRELLLSNPNSVLVIEDAEDLLLARENNKSNSCISTLLNLTDGLLGESLGIQVICSFNTHVKNIDQALLRKGRLIGIYEFKVLCIDKSGALLKGLQVAYHQVTQPMTLAEIYYYLETHHEFNSERRQTIGFKTQVA